MTKPKATEERLDEIRRAAAEGTLTPAAATTSTPEPSQTRGSSHNENSYYGLAALKPPVWTWEVPLYFFFGGIAGVSCCIAFAAQLFHADPALIRVALWMALAGAAICPALLIADLGRPARFLYMLRVFKPQSPMSMGVWILVAFSGCTLLAVASNELILHGYTSSWLIDLRWLGEFTGTIVGLLLSSYTGVLIGATAIPVWYRNRKILPAHFLTSGLGGAAAILELAGFMIPATQVLGFAAAGIETVLDIFFEIRCRPEDAPLRHGKPGLMFRIAGVLEGPAALLLRGFWGHAPTGRTLAAVCFLTGSLLSRYAWIWAGRVSAHNPEGQFELQRTTGRP